MQAFSHVLSDIVKEGQNKPGSKVSYQQQSLFRGVALQSDTAVRASYVDSKILTMKMKSFSDGEIKECLSTVADTAFPD
jgi:hypothetical protein